MSDQCPACGQDLPAPAGSKKCTGPCGQIKPLSEFYKLAHGKDGRRSACKECTKARQQIAPQPKQKAKKHPMDPEVLEAMQQGTLAPPDQHQCAYGHGPADTYRVLKLQPLQVQPVCFECMAKIEAGIRINPYYPEG